MIDRNYDFWMKGNYFHAEVEKDKKPYTIAEIRRKIVRNCIIDKKITRTAEEKLDKIDIGIGKYRKSNLNLLFEVNFRLFFS